MSPLHPQPLDLARRALMRPCPHRLQDLPVFYITAVASVLAYVWLLYILLLSSPSVVEVWEGLVTFFLFPALVLVSYWADIGLCSRRPAKPSSMVIDFKGTDGKVRAAHALDPPSRSKCGRIQS